MARDFAKKRQGTRKAPARKSSQRTRGQSRGGSSRAAAAQAGNGLRWYLAGLLSGIFLSFLLYLGTLPPVGSSAQEAQQAAAPQDPPRPRFDFYTLLPEQTIEVEVEPAEVASPRTSAATELYLLQAGSFRQRDDADRRRAQLLLLGLDPKVEETTGDNGRWFRVYVGPFDSRSKMAKARSLTAAQNIDTLLLKRSRP
jgi:sporulation related protein